MEMKWCCIQIYTNFISEIDSLVIEKKVINVGSTNLKLNTLYKIIYLKYIHSVRNHVVDFPEGVA